MLTTGGRTLSPSSSTPGLDARLLLQHCLGRDHAWLISHNDFPTGSDQAERFRDYIQRRLDGEPVAYIIGAKEFWSLELKVNDQVLVPRPETELLVERALACIPGNHRCRVADLGTGSGAVGLAIASERPHWQLTATDIFAPALEVAKTNARKLGITNVEYRVGNWFEALGGEQYEMIVSNPPYVAETDPCLTGRELKYEPMAALASGPDGLDAIRLIAAAAGDYLCNGGNLILEHGQDQALEVERILKVNGFTDIVCHKDLSGLPRVTECRAVR